MSTSSLAHSAAASLDSGSTARLATSANSTRSTSVVNLRASSTRLSAVSMPSWRHNPSSRYALPIGRDPATVSWSPTIAVTSGAGASATPR